MAGFVGVFPVYDLVFKIGTKGKASTAPTDMAPIANLESFGLAIEGTVEEWTPLDSEGWKRALMTGKGLNLSLKGKRTVGDKGNDYIAGIAWLDGVECSTKAEIAFPDGSKLAFDCVVDVKNVGAGDSTNVAPIEFDLKGDGKPVYTPGTTPA